MTYPGIDPKCPRSEVLLRHKNVLPRISSLLLYKQNVWILTKMIVEITVASAKRFKECSSL